MVGADNGSYLALETLMTSSHNTVVIKKNIYRQRNNRHKVHVTQYHKLSSRKCCDYLRFKNELMIIALVSHHPCRSRQTIWSVYFILLFLTWIEGLCIKMENSSSEPVCKHYLILVPKQTFTTLNYRNYSLMLKFHYVLLVHVSFIICRS